MEAITKKTITNLTEESVSILTQQVVVTVETELITETKTVMQEQDGETVEVEVEVKTPIEIRNETQVGNNHRCAYDNSERGRMFLLEQEPEDIVAEVLKVWGESPTVEEPKFEEYVPEPTLEERVTVIEETLANGGGAGMWDELATAIEEGVNEV